MVFGHLRKGCDGDFFISENQSQAILLVDDLPSFVSMRSAEKIFFAGQLVRYYNSTLSHDNIAGFFEKSIDEKFKNITEISALPFKVRSYNLMIESIRREAALVSLVSCQIYVKRTLIDGILSNKWTVFQDRREY